jgi:hypothetical protein
MNRIFHKTFIYTYFFLNINLLFVYSQNSITAIVEAKSQAWILDNIINPVMSLVLSIAVLVFFYGTVRFILDRNKPEQNANSKKAMFWGLIGIFIIASVWQIMDFVAGMFNSSIRLK